MNFNVKVQHTLLSYLIVLIFCWCLFQALLLARSTVTLATAFTVHYVKFLKIFLVNWVQKRGSMQNRYQLGRDSHYDIRSEESSENIKAQVLVMTAELHTLRRWRDDTRRAQHVQGHNQSMTCDASEKGGREVSYFRPRLCCRAAFPFTYGTVRTSSGPSS